MARSSTTRALTGPYRGPRVRRCDDYWDSSAAPLSTATQVIEIDDAAGVLVVDHRGRPLIASIRPVVGFMSPRAARGR